MDLTNYGFEISWNNPIYFFAALISFVIFLVVRSTLRAVFDKLDENAKMSASFDNRRWVNSLQGKDHYES